MKRPVLIELLQYPLSSISRAGSCHISIRAEDFHPFNSTAIFHARLKPKMAAPQNVEFPRLKSLADYEKWESKVYDHVVEMRNGGPGRGYGRFQVPPLLDRLPEYFASQIRLWPDYISGVLSSDTVLWQLGDAWRRCNCLREYVSKTKSELWEKYLVDPQLICCEECRALRAAVLTVVSEELGDATPETLTVHQGFDYMKGGNGYEIALLDGSDRELLRFDVLESRTGMSLVLPFSLPSRD